MKVLMTKRLCALIIVLLTVVTSQGCKKSIGSEGGQNIIYEETIPGIKKNEPVLLTFNSNNNNEKVAWSITPAAGVRISAVANTATLIFPEAGTFTVLASAGSVAARYIVIVSNIDYSNDGSNFNLTASKLVGIDVDEPVIFKVANATGGSMVKWAVDSRAFEITIDTQYNTAAVVFKEPGFGTVTATDGTTTRRRTVWVNDRSNSNPDLDTVSFILGDKLRLTPSVKTIGSTKQLIIQAATTKTYHCTSDRILSFSNNSDLIIDYSGVVIAKQPCSQVDVARCTNSFNNLTAGNYSFVINLENKTYTGSLNISTDGVYSFNWPDNSTVSISPLQVR